MFMAFPPQTNSSVTSEFGDTLVNKDSHVLLAFQVTDLNSRPKGTVQGGNVIICYLYVFELAPRHIRRKQAVTFWTVRKSDLEPRNF